MVFVTGATGKVGRHVVSGLLERGVEVRALVRDPDARASRTASSSCAATYLSAEAAGKRPRSFWAGVERVIEDSATEWTFLRPTGFAANTRMWADQIRDSGVVRWPYGHAARSLIDERDIAAVAVRVLTEATHVGARYVLTGPEALTKSSRSKQSGTRSAETSAGSSFVETPEVVTSTVEEVTGKSAHPLAEWARDHAEKFR